MSPSTLNLRGEFELNLVLLLNLYFDLSKTFFIDFVENLNMTLKVFDAWDKVVDGWAKVVVGCVKI